MHIKNIITAGTPIEQASRALIMVHGRGGSAEDILTLAPMLAVGDFALLAPQANGNSWYPHSFLMPQEDNEPWLSSALDVLAATVQDIVDAGISHHNICFTGFSQGACLTLEFAARHAMRYGGIVAFTGGLIGDHVHRSNYTGNFGQTPVFIGSSDPDMHVPVKRVHETETVYQDLNANIFIKIYPNMGHTISTDEINIANEKIFGKM
ncbi:alpha/beta hydrolase [Chitinophaga deserti]|uniref:alpha/beta hydrolase n=1 Tax=Chitinophaga deserti TaxID=2164099 RepID=UPI000D6C362A|nr:dienelactone hydrolase family protein [Chitinophaga deserti]